MDILNWIGLIVVAIMLIVAIVAIVGRRYSPRGSHKDGGNRLIPAIWVVAMTPVVLGILDLIMGAAMMEVMVLAMDAEVAIR